MRGQKELWSETGPVSIGPAARGCWFPLEPRCGSERQAAVGTRRRSSPSDPRAGAILFPLKYPFEAHMFGPPRLVFILVQSEGGPGLGSFTGRY